MATRIRMPSGVRDGVIIVAVAVVSAALAFAFMTRAPAMIERLAALNQAWEQQFSAYR